jgi:NAD(P)-dependent dehydrogenase (short-subunit alcohol dehydrogenase family)
LEDRRVSPEGHAGGGATVARLFNLAGQVAIVTGGGSGIGRAAAEILADAGAVVAVTDIDAAASESVAAAIDNGATAHQVDVADGDAVKKEFDAIAARHGRLDVLVSSAGIACRAPSETLAQADWERVMRVNLTGTFLCAQAAAVHMLARGSGSIINIASIMGFVGNPLYGNLAYHTSKGGVVNLTRTLAVEWAPRGVRVNAIAPCFVRTRLTEKLLSDPATERSLTELTPLGRIAEPQDMAGAVLYLASDASAMVTGHILAVDGGWLAR